MQTARPLPGQPSDARPGRVRAPRSRGALALGALALGALALGACVETSECSSSEGCGGPSACYRGYCQAVCKTRDDDDSEALTSPCPGVDDRCVCVPSSEGSACSDQEDRDCDFLVDEYCLCFDQTEACNPACPPEEECKRGACVAIQ